MRSTTRPRAPNRHHCYRPRYATALRRCVWRGVHARLLAHTASVSHIVRLCAIALPPCTHGTRIVLASPRATQSTQPSSRTWPLIRRNTRSDLTRPWPTLAMGNSQWHRAQRRRRPSLTIRLRPPKPPPSTGAGSRVNSRRRRGCYPG